ncbi:uncharacterized protein B0P05DRAFT_533827 [Gilbertella persicaria]|uniref:uncharacterized protein n=1 Tax=Gilbertella persicaria TaxID=101096 RepID=UPI00221F00FC|nr:uncharacterized protein B0P05DRAFT_533827 [Gilbertella persicaria]KAI8085812.1 hypothetical protein B0P05DRAFT_533827 [Gilbertella persicaria]
MMSMMMRYRSHSSSHSNTSSRRSSTISSVSSNHSSGSHKPSHQRSSLLLHQQQQQHFSSKSSISSDKSTKSDTLSQVPKRRQSLGKRIKKALRMSTGTAIQEEEEMDSSHKKKLPDSPNSNISRPTRHHRHPPSFDLPSPALSTVSTISSSTTTFTKKSLSFNPVIKLHETFSAFEYDRRCDTSVTCQKLTPVLALQIKEELNHFKLNDMLVHTDSRQNTHFFI